MSSGTDIERDRAVGLFTFLREFVELRSRPVRDLSTYPQVLWLDDVPEAQDSGTAVFSTPPSPEAWLWIDRRPREEPPAAPTVLEGWLVSSEGRDPPGHLEARLGPGGELEDFASDPQRPSGWSSFLREWNEWAVEDERREYLGTIYARLFDMERKLEREGERLEVLLAVGVLSWQRTYGTVRRHLLVTEARVDLDRDTGRLSVGPATSLVETRLEEDMLDLADRLRGESSEDLGDAAHALTNILDPDDVRPVLERCATELGPEGAYGEEMRPSALGAAHPQVSFAPALIVRPRGERSLIATYNAIVEQLQEGEVSPAVRGLVEPLDDSLTASESQSSGYLSGRLDVEDQDHYLPLAANEQQREIIRRLARRRGVVVQGPPGTGKSHTIANLIADLLARGQRILVTSQTARALEVLKNKLPPEISQLCVSVLGDGRDSQVRLDASVQAILRKRASFDETRSQRQIDTLTATRRKLLERRSSLHRSVVEMREAQTIHVDLGAGFVGSPSQVAERLASVADRFAWLTHAAQGPAPLTSTEAVDLLSLLRTVTQEDRDKASAPRPGSAWLPAPGQLRRWVENEALEQERAEREQAEELDALDHLRADAERARERAEAVRRAVPSDPRPHRGLRGAVQDRLRQVEMCLEALPDSGPEWLGSAVQDALRDRRGSRAEQAAFVDQLLSPLADSAAAVAGRRLSGIDGRALPPLIAQAEGLRDHLASGGKLKGVLRTPEPVRRAQELLESVRLDGSPPDDLTTVELALHALRVQDATTQARSAWSDETDALGEYPAGALNALRAELQIFSQVQDLRAQGSALREALAAAPELTGRYFTEDERAQLSTELRAAADADLLSIEAVEAERLAEHAERKATAAEQRQSATRSDRAERLRAVQKPRSELVAALVAGPSPPGSLGEDLASAARDSDVARFEGARETIEGLERLEANIARLDQLKERLREAEAEPLLRGITQTLSDAAWDAHLAQFEEAWGWRAADVALARLADPALRARLEGELEGIENELQKTVTTLAAERAWSTAFSRMTSHEQQHLGAYAESLRKLGKGTGKYAATRRHEAQEHLDQCQAAVPAWVMPLYRVAQTIPARRDRFDVVIVDEASQAGIDALFLFHLAPKIVVVGDDQQISPENIGINRADVEELQRRHLQGIGLASQLDADTSLFAQAQIRFPGRIVLQEHFRCMPEIIGFSNDLCYRELGVPLVPLRQFGADRLAPLRSIFVPNAYRDGDGTNQRNEPEALALVDALCECLRDPAYEGKTFGIVSLLGQGQGRLLEDLIRERVNAKTILDRQIRVGDAYAFQGDERDVMFLSLVATKEPDRRLNAMTDERSKRRFNVAASRAKDQLWLVHSVQPDDLSPQCVRRKLLSHVLAPPTGTLLGGPDREDLDDEILRDPFESIFEQRVYRMLTARGYNVVPQYDVAGYRIDLVVVGKDGMLAVECDGERFHTAANFEEDLARERELSRCGWTFFRIRGSAFFRDPEEALSDLWPILHRRGIGPPGEVEDAVPAEPPVAEEVPATQVDLGAYAVAPELTQPWSAEPPDEAEDLADAAAKRAAEVVAPRAESRPDEPLRLIPDEPDEAAAQQSLPQSAAAVSGTPGNAPRSPAEGGPVARATVPAGDLAPYTSFNFGQAAATRAFPDPRATGSLLVGQGIEEIVRVEGPIKVQRLFSLYIHATGKSRVSGAVQSALNRELARLGRTNRLVIDNESGTPGYAQSVVRLAGSPEVVVRERGPRKLEEIPMREIAALGSAVVGRDASLTGEALKRALLAKLELVRLTPAADAYLETAIRLSVSVRGRDGS